MSTVSVLSKSDGVVRATYLSLLGDGNALAVNVGYQPRRVVVRDLANLTTYTWQIGLPANNTVKTVAGSAPVLDTTGAIVVTSKDTETQAQLSAGTLEPGVTFSAGVLVAAHTLLVEIS